MRNSKLIDLTRKTKAGRTDQSVVQRRDLRFPSEHLRLHRETGTLSPRRIRTNRRDSEPGAGRKQSAGARVNWRLGRCPRPGNSRATESLDRSNQVSLDASNAFDATSRSAIARSEIALRMFRRFSPAVSSPGVSSPISSSISRRRRGERKGRRNP